MAHMGVFTQTRGPLQEFRQYIEPAPFMEASNALRQAQVMIIRDLCGESVDSAGSHMCNIRQRFCFENLYQPPRYQPHSLL